MSKEQLIKLFENKYSFIDKSLNEFDSDLKTLQEKIYNYLLETIISELEVSNGEIQLNLKNIDKINRMSKNIDLMKEKYANEYFRNIANKMIESIGYSEKYFKALTGKTVSNISDKLERYSSLIGIDGKGKIIKGSFIDNLAEVSEVKNKLMDYMRKAIEGQSNYNEFKKGFKELIKGGDGINGAYEKYVGGFVHDTFFMQGRMQDKFFAEQLGLKNFVYSGTVIETTREFCKKRNNKTYSYQEGLSWNKLDWAGKIPEVDFFTQLGGYGCRHRLMWTL